MAVKLATAALPSSSSRLSWRPGSKSPAWTRTSIMAAVSQGARRWEEGDLAGAEEAVAVRDRPALDRALHVARAKGGRIRLALGGEPADEVGDGEDVAGRIDPL